MLSQPPTHRLSTKSRLLLHPDTQQLPKLKGQFSGIALPTAEIDACGETVSSPALIQHAEQLGSVPRKVQLVVCITLPTLCESGRWWNTEETDGWVSE